VTLQEYIDAQGRGAKRRLQRRTGLAYSTIHWIAERKWVPRLATARLLSEATGGTVTVGELMGLGADDVRANRRRKGQAA
jgi:hypothetical protein